VIQRLVKGSKLRGEFSSREGSCGFLGGWEGGW
jgi:hypothetical protein